MKRSSPLVCLLQQQLVQSFQSQPPAEESPMRLSLCLLLPVFLSAADPNPPRPDPPRLVLPLLKVAPALRWSLVKAAPKGDPRDSLGPLQPLGRPRLDLPLLPYPDQAPARARGYLSFQ